MKLLSIGNSFSQDAQYWLHRMAVLSGAELETVNLVIGGCSLETHCAHIHDGEAAYCLECNGVSTGRMVTLEEGLLLDAFDVITLQQASHFSGRPQTYLPYLPELAAFCRKKQPDAVLYFHQTWAYNSDTIHGAFGVYNHDQQEMFRRIQDCSALASGLIGAPLLPVGEVIQTLRETVPEFAYENGGRSLCVEDGFHLSTDYGRFSAAAVWFRVLTGRLPVTVGYEGLEPALLEKIIAVVDQVVGKYYEDKA
ncbi:MAG: DUF4886 domain-containing protein [Clostridia bacterium]|nr:DUF4886 domain-containing protein [Clostridia bacterium]